MKKSFCIIPCLLFAILAWSQNCDKDELAKRPGKWKTGMKGQIRNVTPKDLVKEKLVMDNIHKMISTNYTPTGCVAQYHSVYGKELVAAKKWYADPYYYTIYILRYLCDPNNPEKSYTDTETPAKLTIAANTVFSLNNLYAAEMPDDDMRGYLKLKKRPEIKDGFYFMGEEVIGNSHLTNKIIEYRWLVTYGDTLPFSYVSQREYLLIQKKRIEKYLAEVPSETKYMSTFLARIEGLLANGGAGLNTPAICMWNEEERFEKFVPEGTKGSFIAVKPNPSYYKKTLTKSSPQFFSVVYAHLQGDEVIETNIEKIQQAVDLAKLRSMLGK